MSTVPSTTTRFRPSSGSSIGKTIYHELTYDVSTPSLRASASYKYFGNGEGVVIYSGLDEAGQLIYTVVFNAAERESPYVLDVVLHNNVIQTQAHATDMHGFSEVNRTGGPVCHYRLD
jgi:hypothetical protein